MKILITNTYYFPAFVGGAEISVKLLAEGLRATGNQVYVLTTGVEDKVYTVNGVIVISIKQLNIFNSYDKKPHSQFLKVFWHLLDSLNFLYYFKVKSILKRIQPDIAHTNSIQGFSPFLWYIIKQQKIPLVHSMRDYYMLCHKCSLYNSNNCNTLCSPCKTTHSVKKHFFKFPDRFIGISNFILSKYQSYHPQIAAKSRLIYNAVDTRNTSFNTSEPTQKIVFGYIGRIDSDKGVSYMVDEIASLDVAEKSNLKILFAGHGNPGFINKLKLKLKLNDVECEFLGVVKQDDFYHNINVLVVPALWNEPFGRIVIESLSYMVPVCQSDRGGLKELYSSDTSWIFSPSKGQLAAQLSYILKNREQLAVKKANCVREARNFSVQKYISKHLSLYKEVTGDLVSQAVTIATKPTL
ncbi:glycosyltransferase [Mucilaginibacter pallidiroseus]|uniref:Glycosyltransferase n=1 Tax=Mucilaginibacter pallidiroseus TaxID=2599295 RepID=A0A563UBV2_9SPHI|nr:glycosyltransferase family 4 protein [Mucilaginibacter pallidiroseus]TWR28852.1 glycosyltransferase [Mucilaginibacter pallidiroseus]